MNSNPKISIFLTSYNHGKYLHESIKSVLNQTYQDYELIILDDASQDDSWEIIHSYTDPRIKAFRNAENRKGIRLNDAIVKLSAGEYIAVHHSDDVWEDRKLEKQVAYLDSHPQIGAVFTLVTLIDEQSQIFSDLYHKDYRIFDQPNRTRHEWLNHFFFIGNALCHPSILIRRDCYQDMGLPRRGLAQVPDLDGWIRLCMKYEIFILQEKLIRFRIRAGAKNASGNRPDTRIRDHYEKLQLLNNYRSISTAEEFIKYFPGSLEAPQQGQRRHSICAWPDVCGFRPNDDSQIIRIGFAV